MKKIMTVIFCLISASFWLWATIAIGLGAYRIHAESGADWRLFISVPYVLGCFGLGCTWLYLAGAGVRSK